LSYALPGMTLRYSDHIDLDILGRLKRSPFILAA